MSSASVACKADRRAFLCYKCGVLIQACGTEFDHSVLAVGYSSEGECGIDMLPSYPGVSGAPGQSPGLPLPSPQSPPTPPWTTYDEKPPYQADETEALVPGAHRCRSRKVVLIARLLWETLLGMKARLLSRMLW